jgi:3-methyladenine DNA glycosylase AlkD
MPVPAQRKVARRHRDLPLDECERLLRSEVHEHRFVALAILRGRFERGDRAERETIAGLYLANRDRVNNWDLVDASAPYVLADRVRRAPRKLLDPLLRSASVWDRRIAVLATFSLIRAGEFDETLRCCEALLADEHDLIHKATGWMLREVGKRDEATLRAFLDAHAAAMPRTMLRYAIERLQKEDRQQYLAARSVRFGSDG